MAGFDYEYLKKEVYALTKIDLNAYKEAQMKRRIDALIAKHKIKENKIVFSTVLLHSVSFGFNEIFQRLYDNIFNPILERYNYPATDRKYAMMFYLNGITSVVKEWLKDGCEKSIEEVAQIIYGCIFGLENDVG